MDAWPRCLERLEAEFPAEDVHTWLKPLQARSHDSATVLYAPNAFVRDEVQSRYLSRIRELLAHYAGSREVLLEIGSLPRAAAPPGDAGTAVSPSPSAPAVAFAGNQEGTVRDAGPEAMRSTPQRAWTKTDEESDQSFPASDPPATY